MLESVLSKADLAAGELPWDAVFRVLDDVQRPLADEVPDTGARPVHVREVAQGLMEANPDRSRLIHVLLAYPEYPNQQTANSPFETRCMLSYIVHLTASVSTRIDSIYALPYSRTKMCPWRYAHGCLRGGGQGRGHCAGPTGVSREFEEVCSSIHVPIIERLEGGPYGTRSKTVIAFWADGSAELREKSMDADRQWHECRHTFTVPLDETERRCEA